MRVRIEAGKTIRFLDEDEAKRLVRLLNREDPKWRTATLLLLTTGLRRGELMGLEWSDINFRKGLISVNRASQYTANGYLQDRKEKH